jgi:hypothetical protein
MQQISFFLNKFEGLLPPDYVVRNAVCEVLGEYQIKVSMTEVSVRGSRVYVSADGYIKAEIFQNQKAILAGLLQRLSRYKVSSVG